MILCSILVDIHDMFVHVHALIAYTIQLAHVDTITLALFTKTKSSVQDYTCIQEILLTVYITNIILREQRQYEHTVTCSII